jgi:hypothetical protein
MTRSRVSHRIHIERVGRRAWRVVYDGEVLVERARLPATAAARCLLQMGLSGRVIVCHRGKEQYHVDLVQWSGPTVDEPPRKSGVVRRVILRSPWQ